MLRGIEERYSLADLLTGRRRWDEVVETAPGGLRLIAGACWADEFADGSTAADLLLERLQDRECTADAVVVDVGNYPSRAMQRIGRSADALLVVTTCDTPAVAGAFRCRQDVEPFGWYWLCQRQP